MGSAAMTINAEGLPTALPRKAGGEKRLMLENISRSSADKIPDGEHDLNKFFKQ